MYVSEGFDDTLAREVFDKLMKPMFEKYIQPDDIRLPVLEMLKADYKCQQLRVERKLDREMYCVEGAPALSCLIAG